MSNAMSKPHTIRVGQFMAMVKAHIDLTCEEDGGPKENQVVFNFMGSGASDILTYGCIKNFLEENGWSTEQQNN